MTAGNVDRAGTVDEAKRVDGKLLMAISDGELATLCVFDDEVVDVKSDKGKTSRTPIQLNHNKVGLK